MPEPGDIGIGIGPIGVDLDGLFQLFGLYGNKKGGGKSKRARAQDRRRISAEKHELGYHKYRQENYRGRYVYTPAHRYFQKLLAQKRIRVPNTKGITYEKAAQVTPEAWRTNPEFKPIRRELERLRRTKLLFNIK